jgi:hypothetical protein
MTFSIKLENKFKMVPRNIQVVRRNSWGEILDEHRVSCPEPETRDVDKESKPVIFSLGSVDQKEDYLEISVVEDEKQPDLGPCKIDLKKNVPFRFIPGETESITVMMVSRFEEEEGEIITSLKIPSGPPTWKLEIMSPPGLPRDGEGSTTNVKVGDDDPGGWD